jgi:hypothetical protein
VPSSPWNNKFYHHGGFEMNLTVLSAQLSWMNYYVDEFIYFVWNFENECLSFQLSAADHITLNWIIDSHDSKNEKQGEIESMENFKKFCLIFFSLNAIKFAYSNG